MAIRLLQSRRTGKRRIRGEVNHAWWRKLQADGTMGSLLLALVFVALGAAIFMLRNDGPAQRPGEYVNNDIYARVDFDFNDPQRLTAAREQARDAEPPVFKSNGDVWSNLAESLRQLPDRVAGRTINELPASLRDQFTFRDKSLTTSLDAAALTSLDQSRSEQRRNGYLDSVKTYVDLIRPLIVIPAEVRDDEIHRQQALGTPQLLVAPAKPGESPAQVPISQTFAATGGDELIAELSKAAQVSFPRELQAKIVAYTLNTLRDNPTHVLDEDATVASRTRAAANVPASAGTISRRAGTRLVEPGVLTSDKWALLKAEHAEYMAHLSSADRLFNGAGIVLTVLLVTCALGGYIKRYQPRIIRNHARGVGMAVLLLSMLLLAQLAGIGSGPLYAFGAAPTILVAMILAIAYDRRFALGVSTCHAMMVTAALGQGIGFFMILFVGVLTCCYMMDDIRSRIRLIEIGGMTALAMMGMTLAVGATSLEPISYVGRNCLFAGAAGLAAGFVVLGILPFIEKAFRITTGMTLLELADASHPLLRRLAMEAPGTYSHSLQVATLAESAAESIGANSLLTRVGAYYHDIGKINKPDYFIENQTGGINRHINLSPSVSLLIIIGHVKDGMELAREYNLPTSLMPFIQQHHGTTLVEYFYRQACQQKDQNQPDHPAVSEQQYRYPGPRPRSRELGIVMLADAVESATRSMVEPTANRVETLVHELMLRRLLDGQFDDCELTMRELEVVERTMMKTLLSIYHGRIAYPSTAAIAQPNGPQSSSGSGIRTA